LLSHSIGISNSYYRPTEKELLEDYLKVVDLLSIDKENRLEKKLKEYAKKDDEENYLIKGKLQERDEQIKVLIKKQQQFENMIQMLIDSGQLKKVN
jgi:hypothetical protein